MSKPVDVKLLEQVLASGERWPCAPPRAAVR